MSEKLQPGMTLPDFELADDEGAVHRLSELQGDDQHDTNKLKISTGAYWTYLCDEDLEVQSMLEIDEYTDPHHSATVPHTLVLAPGLLIDKAYVGYWFFGRPSAYQLWDDLQDLFRRIRDDFDPTLAEVRARWEAAAQLAA